MPRIPDVFAQFASMEGAVIPEGMLDALLAAAGEDSAESDSIWQAKNDELSTSMTGMDNDLQAAKAKIADLMTAASADIDPNALETFDDPDAPDDENPDIDDMFSDSPDDEDDK